MKTVFEYTDYRQFLRDYYDDMKVRHPGFSFATFAQRAGLDSRAHLKLVMDGKRNLTHRTIAKFSSGLRLDKAEAAYFENLVYFNQAHDLDEQVVYLQRLAKCIKSSKAKELGVLQYEFYAQWYTNIIYVMTAMTHFRSDPEWLATQLGGRIKPIEAKRAINILLDMGLIEERDGHLVQSKEGIKTSDDIRIVGLRNYYRAMLLLAKERISDPLDMREFGGLSIVIDKKGLAVAKEMLRNFRAQLHQSLASLEVNPDEEKVYQFLLAGFRITE